MDIFCPTDNVSPVHPTVQIVPATPHANPVTTAILILHPLKVVFCRSAFQLHAKLATNTMTRRDVRLAKMGIM